MASVLLLFTDVDRIVETSTRKYSSDSNEAIDTPPETFRQQLKRAFGDKDM